MDEYVIIYYIYDACYLQLGMVTKVQFGQLFPYT
jgi:hypothetical protein